MQARKVKKHTKLIPQTSTKPITITEYVIKQHRSRIIDGDRLTEEWKAWYDAQLAKF